MKASTKSLAIATAVAGLLTGGAALAEKAEKADTKVKCAGVNDCKGKSSCKGAHNDCKGQNACKGQGTSMMKSEKECTAKGGTVAGQK